MERTAVRVAERVRSAVRKQGQVTGRQGDRALESLGFKASTSPRELGRLGMGYLHVTEAVSGQGVPSPEQRISPLMRKAFPGAFIVNGGYDAKAGEAAIALGDADLVAYGVPFLANPDLLPARDAPQPGGRLHLLHRRGEGLHGRPDAALSQGATPPASR